MVGTRKRARNPIPQSPTTSDTSKQNAEVLSPKTKKRRIKKKKAGEDGFEKDESNQNSPASTRPSSPDRPEHLASSPSNLSIDFIPLEQKKLFAKEESELRNKVEQQSREEEENRDTRNNPNGDEALSSHLSLEISQSDLLFHGHQHDSDSTLTSLESSEEEDASTSWSIFEPSILKSDSILSPSSPPTTFSNLKSRRNNGVLEAKRSTESVQRKSQKPSTRKTSHSPKNVRKSKKENLSASTISTSSTSTSTSTVSTTTDSFSPTYTPTSTTSTSSSTSFSKKQVTFAKPVLSNHSTSSEPYAMSECVHEDSDDSLNDSNESVNGDLPEDWSQSQCDYKIWEEDEEIDQSMPIGDEDVDHTDDAEQREEEGVDEDTQRVKYQGLQIQYYKLSKEFSLLYNRHQSKVDSLHKCQAGLERLSVQVSERETTILELYKRLEELEKTNQNLSQQISGIELDRAQNSKQVGLFSLQLNPVKLTTIVQDFEMALEKFSRNLLIHPDNKSRIRTEIIQAMVQNLMPVHLRQLQMVRYVGCLIYRALYDHISRHHPLDNVVSTALKALGLTFVTTPPTSFLRDWYFHTANAETRNPEVWEPFREEVLSRVCTTLESIRMQVSEEHYPILRSLIHDFLQLFFTVLAMDCDFTFPEMGDLVSEHTMNCDGIIDRQEGSTTSATSTTTTTATTATTTTTPNGDESSEIFESVVLFAATPCLRRLDCDGDVVFSKASVFALHRPSQLDGLADVALTMDPLPLSNGEQTSEDDVQMV